MLPLESIKPNNTVFVVLCFEGPDAYAMAGGLGVRVANLTETLAQMGFTTHLFFIGDPRLKGEELRLEGKLILHRWCQWISKYHPEGVYQGENEKLYDFNESLPGYVMEQIVRLAAEQGKIVAILGEEWHTAEAMCRISDLLYYNGLRDRAVMFWNANNTMSFHRINWGRLNFTTTITTVSRYMKHIMWGLGVNPLVIPNGIPSRLLQRVDRRAAMRLRRCVAADLVLTKVARWDPDKRWNMAVEAMARVKEKEIKTVFLVRGGIEPHGREVLHNARSLGLVVRDARTSGRTFDDFLVAVEAACGGDIINIRFPIPEEFLRVIYCAADAVLANSGHEPFGLVGLEAMAAGGVPFLGGTGEDYARHMENCIVLETADPAEIENYILYLRQHREEEERIRKAARRTAYHYTWEAVIRNLIHKLEYQGMSQGILARRRLPGLYPAEAPEDDHEAEKVGLGSR